MISDAQEVVGGSDLTALRAAAIELVARAAEGLWAESGEPPTASKVRLQMSALSYGGFSLKRLQYRRFRDLVQDAVAQGKVEVDDDHPGDLLILPAGAARERKPLRPIVWRAVVDWAPNMIRVWDRQENRAVYLPQTPAPLEPARFANDRALLHDAPERFIPLPQLDQHAQLDLFRQFVDDTPVPDDLRPRLADAVRSNQPIKRGLALLEDNDPQVADRWSAHLRTTVEAKVREWAAHHPEVEEDALFNRRRRQESHTSEHDETTALRQALHRAIDAMSVEDLRSLRVPAGYLVRV